MAVDAIRDFICKSKIKEINKTLIHCRKANLSLNRIVVLMTIVKWLMKVLAAVVITVVVITILVITVVAVAISNKATQWIIILSNNLLMMSRLFTI